MEDSETDAGVKQSTLDRMAARAAAEARRPTRCPRIGGNETIDVHVVKRHRYDPGAPIQILNHARYVNDHRAVLAVAFVDKWAMVAGETDGEDSAGRQKLRRLTPDELAAHACDTVEALEKEFAARGWKFDQPSLDELATILADGEDDTD